MFKKVKLDKITEKENPLIYTNIKIFAQNKKELKPLIQTIRIRNQDIGMEFGTEK